MRSSSKRPRSNDCAPQLMGDSPSRRTFRQLLAGVLRGEKAAAEPKRGRLLLESLESRQLMAGDVELLFTEGADSPIPDVPAETQTGLTSQRAAEGESAPDLVQFAKDLAAAGVQFYGAHWCPACTEQKELFADGKDNLPFIEVTNSDRTLNQIGVDEGISSFPTWVFQDDSRETGVLSLETLSARSGVAIPQSDQPTFEEVGETTVQIGSPFHIPIDAYSPDGSPLTVTVSVDNPSLLEATVLQGNRSIRVDMQGYGDMVFELFEQRAPVASGRVADLAEAGFYDGIIFHRVTSNFVIQAGDPTGTGTSGSSLGEFDDDFHPDLQHNRGGVLSFAKSSDDTNNSQFFVTEVPTRFLDFNHSIFGQLVEGEDVREAISSTSTPESRGAGSSQRPDIDAVIETVEVFEDNENAVIMLKATGNAVGATNVTVTVTDQDGDTHSETFQVNVVGDTANSQPFLNDIATPATTAPNTSATLQLSSVDVEGDAVRYFAQSLSNPNDASVSVDSATGLVTVTPATDFVGTINVQVGVEPGAGVVGNSPSDFDSQTVAFTFDGGTLSAPTSVDLLTSSDTGSSNIDNVTNAGSLSFVVQGVATGSSVELVDVSSGSVIGSGFATGSEVTITTSNIAALGDGTYQIAARQRTATQTSALSSIVSLTYDTTVPNSVVDSAATRGNVGRLFQTDLVSDEEGTGLRYSLNAAPSGATIDPITGVILWTPTAGQTGANDFSLELTDAAGNSRSELFSVDVAEAPLAEVKLELVDLDGNPINSVAIGEEFLVRFIGVDARISFDRDGIFAAYADILFDSSLIRPVPGATIQYDAEFPSVNKGEIADGLIDEIGAATDRLTATGLEESLIATIRFEALAPGTVNVRTEPADEVDSEFLLYGLDDLIPASAVAYGSATLAIGQSFTTADDNFTVLEDSGTTLLDVLANDVVVSGSTTLSVVGATALTSGGTVSVLNNDLRFTPDANFSGTFEFTYRVSDSKGIQDDATATVTVTPVNDAPIANTDTFNVTEGSSDNVLDVLSNDSTGPDGNEVLSVAAVGNSSAGGTVEISSDGLSVVYTPPSGFTGTDTFRYTLSDGGLTDEVQVNVVVAPADDPPSAVDDSFTLNEDTPEAAYDVLANDTSDGDGEAFLLNSVSSPSEGSGGVARISADGTQLFYTPAADFNGTEEIAYTIRDTGGGLSIGTVTFTVNPVNDAPPIASPNIQRTRGSDATVVLTLDDLPVNVDDGETLAFGTDLGIPSAGGSAEIDDATGSILYTPPTADFTGTDTFTYTVTDGSGETSTGTISVEVLSFEKRVVSVRFTDANGTQLSNVMLSGTDALGNAISVPLTYAADSFATFPEVFPGEFTIDIPAVPFFQNTVAAQRIAVTSAADDGDVTVDVELGSLRPEFISIQDWLGSAPKKSILVAVEEGKTEVVSVPSSDTSPASNPTITRDAATGQLTVNGVDDLGQPVQAEVAATPSLAVLPRGVRDGFTLMRLNVEELDFDSAPQNDSAAEGEFVGEGEFVTQDVLVGQRQAEGESPAAQAVVQADVFVPVAADVETRTDATVLPLEDGDVWLGESLVDGGEPNSPVAAVDDAMGDVGEELVLVSALEEGQSESMDESAVDAVLSGELNS